MPPMSQRYEPVSQPSGDKTGKLRHVGDHVKPGVSHAGVEIELLGSQSE